MRIFELHKSIINDYSGYIRSFLNIKDQRIKSKVLEDLDSGALWPDPLIQFNPTFEKGETVDSMVKRGLIHEGLNKVFKGYSLFRHQTEAIGLGVKGESFIVTSGTGSGKSLTFLSTIFDYLLKNNYGQKGIKAILVYPMNALINSQEEEIKKYAENYGEGFPISFAKYTGQEGGDERERIKKEEPDIILTNYMMLELIMTRATESGIRNSIFKNLKYLVFDELHTYRGRQGSDVSLLNRRIHAATDNDLICIGTSATMASGDTIEQEKIEVAKVGKQIFNTGFTTSHIIGEYLQNCTEGPSPEQDELLSSLEIDQSAGAEAFKVHPIARWLENNIAIKRLADGFKKRGMPLKLIEIAEKFSEATGLSSEESVTVLTDFLSWGEYLNEQASRQKDRKSYLPFKFHQFIAQTGNVSVTLEDIETRHITTEVARYLKQEDKEEVSLFPVLFSRVSGHEFICVSKNTANNRLEPRDPRELPNRITKDELKGSKELKTKKRALTEFDFLDGYVIIPHNDEKLWSEDMIDDFPDSWKRITKKETSWDNFYEYRLPHDIFVKKDGSYSSTDNGGVKAFFIPTHVLYDPTSGIIYDSRVNEFTKLMKLGNEGRSTATTVTALSTLNALREQKIDLEYQKLLSFTDNRQDASLQSGHFNDFVSTIQLRSAIYHALKDRRTLDVNDIAKYAVQKLGLKEGVFASRPSTNPKYPDPANIEALEDYVLIRTLYDLKRGWRYNTPNLEQCALLEINYKTLDQLSEDEEEWKKTSLIASIPSKDRREVIQQILDYFRTSYALDHFKLSLDQRGIIENKSKDRLLENSNWSFGTEEKIDAPYIMIPVGVGKTPKGIYTAGCGHQSYIGKYFKRLYKKYGFDDIPKGDALTEEIIATMDIMEGANMLSGHMVKGSGEEVKGYQLRLDQVVWTLGDEQKVIDDQVRTYSLQKFTSKPNQYFQDYYKLDFTGLEKEIKGGEHTGQIKSDDRETREKDFREGKLSAMFCSPTMELGVDISSMNVVHMRNVPPGPANYAQRSGRAGRSGQTALVMTYCSNGSPHDRHYFSNQIDMVSGGVAAPRLDLTNEELIASHLNAFVLMNIKLDGVHTSVNEVLDLSNITDLPVKETIKEDIGNRLEEFKPEWKKEFTKAISSLASELDDTNWYTQSWLDKRFNGYLETFDKAFDRWRKLYWDAENLIQKARRVMDDPTLKASSQEKKDANWDHKRGLKQKELLLNDSANMSFSGASEFYVFRYLASEGFLPGYNFTRMPIRTFLGDRDKGEYLSRPRFVALKEYGPGNLIYHSGSKYRINRMMVNDAESKMHKLKICNSTGYVYLDEEGDKINNDPITGVSLSKKDEAEVKTNVLELAESHTRSVERISCEEEERTSTGYHIDQYFNFSKGIHSTTKTVLSYDDEEMLKILYGPSTTLLQFNRKWKRAKEADEGGYRIGLTSGFWKKEKDEEKQTTNDPIKKVHVYTTDTADVLYIQPVSSLTTEEGVVITLNYAIKRAIEMIFQIEERELSAWIMGNGDCPNILLYEASEGSLGVLKELATNPDRLKEVFKKAAEICYFDPETLEETAEGKRKERASYDDLLSYFNQRHHDQIDRRVIQDPLKKLVGAKIEVSKKIDSSYQERFEEMIERYDKSSSTEYRFLNYLYNKGIRLPDLAQVNLKDYFISADFIYTDDKSGEQTVVFIDGSVHDKPEVKEKDEKQRAALKNAGADVIVWRYDEELDELMEKRKDIFRKEIAE